MRALVSIGVSADAAAPGLHRVFTEELPALGFTDVAAADADVIREFRRLLEHAAIDLPDLDRALWMVATISSAVIHRATIERPEDLANGRIAEELTTLLMRYLRPRYRGPRPRPRIRK